MMGVWNFILAFFQLIMIVIILVREVGRKSPVMFLWATGFVMFGLPHLVDVMIGTEKYPAWIMISASAFVIVFCIIYMAAREIVFKGVGQRGKLKVMFEGAYASKLGNAGKNNIVYIALLLICIGMVLNIVMLSGGLLNASWGKSYEIESSYGYFDVRKICSYAFFAFGGVLCCSIIRKEKTSAVYFFAFLAVELVIRSKVYLMPLVVSILSVMVFKIKKIRLSTMIGGLAASVVVLLMIYVIQATRWMGDWGSVMEEISISSLIKKLKYFFEISEGELFLRQYFYYYMERNNCFKNFGQMHSYIRMLLVYIPTRLSFGIKPPDFAISMGAAIGMPKGGSMHPTFFGDCFANLGYAGVLIGSIWAFVASLADSLLARMKNDEKRVLAFVLMGTSYVIMGRGSVYNGYTYTAFGLPIIYAFYSISIKRLRIKIKLDRSSYGRKKIQKISI